MNKSVGTYPAARQETQCKLDHERRQMNSIRPAVTFIIIINKNSNNNLAMIHTTESFLIQSVTVKRTPTGQQ